MRKMSYPCWENFSGTFCVISNVSVAPARRRKEPGSILLKVRGVSVNPLGHEPPFHDPHRFRSVVSHRGLAHSLRAMWPTLVLSDSEVIRPPAPDKCEMGRTRERQVSAYANLPRILRVPF